MDLNKGDTRLIIEAAEADSLSIEQTAYVLATALWETNHTMKPVREAYWLSESWRKNNLRYYPWYGRGYVQLTWRENYARAGRELGLDLTTDADVVMQPEIAAKILVRGSREGLFTDRKLSDYISGDKKDYINARRIINGTDKAAQIATLAREYESALRLEVKDVKRDLQRELASLGLYKLKIDGIWGQGSRDALGAWRKSKDRIEAGLKELEE